MDGAPSAPADSPRVAAIATLRRAASTRSAKSASPSPSRSPPSASPSPAAAPPSRHEQLAHRRRSRSFGPALAAPPGTLSAEDRSLFAGASSLERTASLLARQLAMAKLTGTAPPPAPRGLFADEGEVLPTLDELQQRARAKLANAGGPAAKHAGRLARNNTVSEASAPVSSATAAADALRRNNTVTGARGRGGAADEGPSRAAEGSEAAAPQDDSRAAARVNLMRKLSARRLAGPSAPTPSGSPRARLDVVGRIGRARPRSGSVGALDWRDGALGAGVEGGGEEGGRLPPPVPLPASGGLALGAPSAGGSAPVEADEREVLRNSQLQPPLSGTTESGGGDVGEQSLATPRVEQQLHLLVADRTPQPGSAQWGAPPSPGEADELASPATIHPARLDQETQDARSSYRSNPYGESGSTSSSTGSLASEDPASLLAAAHSAREADASLRRAPPIPSFGLVDNSGGGGAGGDADEWMREARKRGSSASSSLAGIMEAAQHRWRGSDANVALPNPPFPPTANTSAAPSPFPGTSFSGPSGGAQGLVVAHGGAGAVVGLGVGGVPTSTSAPSAPPQQQQHEPARRPSAVSATSTASGQSAASGASLVGGEREQRLRDKVELQHGESLRRAAQAAQAASGGPRDGDGSAAAAAAEGAAARTSGAAGQKSEGFPPPEVGYQFPSPVASPRESLDASKFPQAGPSDLQDPHKYCAPHSLFKQLASKSSPSPGLSSTATSGSPTSPTRRGREFPFTLSNYHPFASPKYLAASPVLPDPVSPTSVIPDPMTAIPSVAASTHRVHNAVPIAQSNGMERQESQRSYRSAKSQPQSMVKSASTESGASFRSAGAASSSYHSPSVSMRRDLSSSASSASSHGDPFPVKPRVPALPAEHLPASRILAKLDSMLAHEEHETALDPSQPSALDAPPRTLVLHAPVLQVVNANTVKDRHLFLFSDLLVIAKPIVEDHPLTGEPQQPSLETHFLVKSVVECKDVKLTATEEPSTSAAGMDDGGSSKKRHPLLIAFVDRFANDPARAIASLVQKGGLANDGQTIANLLFRNTDLNRNQLGAYLANPQHRHVLRAYIERFRFAGVRIDDAVRLFVMTVRLPYDAQAAEYVLGVLAACWTESNGATAYDPTVTLALVMALLRLSDAMHGGDGPDGRFFNAPKPPNPPNVDDFISSFRLADTRSVVPEDLLTRIYTSVRRERIEQASDNSIFSMTPDIEASIEPAKLPTRLTYRQPSDVFTISIPEPDPKFTIKLHGTDLQFDPPMLSFARSKTQSFRVTGTALGVRVMVLIKRGANAPRYQGLPLNKAFSVERGFMQHTFQLSFTNHLDVKRKYMFSCISAEARALWLKHLRDRIGESSSARPASDQTLLAAHTASVQALRDVLLPPEEPITVPAAAPSPRPNIAAPRFGQPVSAPVRAGGRLGTPTRAGTSAAGLARSNSVSRLYATHFRHEADLAASGERRRGGPSPVSGPAAAAGGKNGASAATPGPTELTTMQALYGAYLKTGQDLILTTEQNSLLPLVLAFLQGGADVAPHPLSLQGSAFQLAPLSSAAPAPLPSFVAPGTAL
ncbi:uncharacterized protein JCM10292_004665 [Rhodotorula paludigena]|uniref:uncharacterized protein n=1 Tax=Rhodotorula paludigena TaxID=86838 RepID=UPI0031763A41